jgi:hypothetical protein
MSTRYGLGSKGVLTYDTESTAYTEASSPDTEFGITNDDIEPPNPNPQTAMVTGAGGRQPYIQSPDPKEYSFSVPTVAHNPDLPLEIALGSRTETSKTNYTEFLFEEADRLPTATIRHSQADIDMLAYYVGCKASFSAEWSLGDPLSFSFDVTAAKMNYNDGDSAPSVTPSLPTDVSPYRAHMQGDLTLTDQQSNTVAEVATINGGTFGVDNGLEIQHHGGDGTGSNRDGYAVAETTGADKYDISFDLNITDTTLYNEAATNDTLVDAEIPFVRQYNSGNTKIVDGVIFRANECKIVDAPIPRPAEGVIESSVELQPQGGVEVEVREP